MPWKSWKSESRIDWGVDLGDGKYLDNERIQLGAILRIADALEKLCELLDPVKRANLERKAAEEIEENKLRAERIKNRALWPTLKNHECKAIMKKARERFAPAKPTQDEKKAYAWFYTCIESWLLGDVAYQEKASRSPTPEEVAAFQSRLAMAMTPDFDCRPFLNDLTPKQRGRIAAILDRLDSGAVTQPKESHNEGHKH